MKIGDINYTVKLMNTDIKFNYYPKKRGKFDCKDVNSEDKAKELCKKLTH